MELGDVSLEWLGHSGFLIKNSKIIYIDPYEVRGELPKADVILITHSHYDHCSVADMKKIVKDGTRIIMTADCQSKVTRFDEQIKLEIIEPGQEADLGSVKITALPSYNIDKSFHPKEEGWVSYCIKMGTVIIYHAGDSDVIPEMKNLTGHKQPGKRLIALLPVGGRFTMSAEEAFEAAKIIKPDVAVPMHYGSVIGDKNDAEEFCELCNEEGINCEVLERK